jgi:hypothetical protein
VSRYLILIVLNLPLILAGILSTLVSYKLKRTSRRKFIFRLLFWLIILVGIVFAEPIYAFLFSNQLTETEPLSLFDVIQITGIVFTLYIASQALLKVSNLEHKIQDLHQELSIRISKD